MFEYLKEKLGIGEILKAINAIPVENKKYSEVLIPIESFMQVLMAPEGDDSLVMHKLRSMGYCGGWKIRDEYLKGALHGVNSKKIAELAENYRKHSPLTAQYQSELASMHELLKKIEETPLTTQ